MKKRARASFSRNIRRGFLTASIINICDEDPCALFSKAFGYGTPNAMGCSGDDCGFAFESHVGLIFVKLYT